MSPQREAAEKYGRHGIKRGNVNALSREERGWDFFVRGADSVAAKLPFFISTKITLSIKYRGNFNFDDSQQVLLR